MADKLEDLKLVAMTLLRANSGDFGNVELRERIKEIGQAKTDGEVRQVIIDSGVPSAQVSKMLAPDVVMESAQDLKDSLVPTPKLDFSDRPGFDDKLDEVYDFIEESFEFGAKATTTSASTQMYVDSANTDVKSVLDQLIDGGVNLRDSVLREASAAETEDEALRIIVSGSSEGEVQEINKVIDQPGSYLSNVLITPMADAATPEAAIQYMTEAALRKQGITAKLSENHDELVGMGMGLYVQKDENDVMEVLYVDSTGDRRVTNFEGADIGKWEPTTGTIESFTTLDTRLPIGMESGSFVPEGEKVNVVAGRTDATARDFYDLYGFDYTDIVNDMDFETILRDTVGLSEFNIMRIKSGNTLLLEKFDDKDLDIDLHFQYLAGENINTFIDMPLENFTGYQKEFEGMGVYTAPQYGKFDPEFTRIVNATMAYANQNFEADPNGFDKAIADFAANGALASAHLRGSRGGGTTRVWRPPAYLAPDYAELSQAVKTTFETKLGRAPSGAEVMLLSDKMKADHRGEFDAQVEGQRLQFFGAGGTDAGTVQDVNYAARFQEDFESKYSDELGTLDKSQMQNDIMSKGLGSILAADRAIGY